MAAAVVVVVMVMRVMTVRVLERDTRTNSRGWQPNRAGDTTVLTVRKQVMADRNMYSPRTVMAVDTAPTATAALTAMVKI